MDAYFFKADKCLSRKRKEACEDLCKFVKMDFADRHPGNQIKIDEIEISFISAHKLIELQFKDECKFLRECRDLSSDGKYEFRDSVIDGIQQRQLKKIEDFKNYKLSVVRGHCKSKGYNDQSISKYDLEKLLSKTTQFQTKISHLDG